MNWTPFCQSVCMSVCLSVCFSLSLSCMAVWYAITTGLSLTSRWKSQPKIEFAWRSRTWRNQDNGSGQTCASTNRNLRGRARSLNTAIRTWPGRISLLITVESTNWQVLRTLESLLFPTVCRIASDAAHPSDDCKQCQRTVVTSGHLVRSTTSGGQNSRN